MHTSPCCPSGRTARASSSTKPVIPGTGQPIVNFRFNIRGAQRFGHGERRDAVQHPVLAGRAKPILDPPAVDQGFDVAARILQAARDETRLRRLVPAEADDPPDAEIARMTRQPLVVPGIAIHRKSVV